MPRPKIKKGKLSENKKLPTPLSSSQITNHVLYFIEQSKLGITEYCLQQIETQLLNISGESVFLVIHTLGGDIYTAVRIVLILRDKFKKIKVLIPEYAYSSGTIISLGGHEIYMDKDAMLGPLDKPMEHPTDGSEISSLDITKTLPNISSTGLSMAMSIYKKLRNNDDKDLRIGKIEAAKIAFKTTTEIITSITSKIDPYHLQKGYRETQIARNYALDLLSSGMMKDDFYLAIETSNSLVNNYPSHGYGIFRKEAKDVLKLNIMNLEDLPEWSKIKPEFDIIKSKARYFNYKKI
ncbi:MAG: SppA protein [uncultured bacterium]|nr:MAG: SppA protein [uncultured bacterium]